MRSLRSLLFILLPAIPACHAAVIASVGPGGDFGRSLTVLGSGAYGFGWRQTGTFNNVSIQVPIFEQSQITGGAPGVLNVFLTNQVGPGTTAANEVVPAATVAFPALQSGLLTMFSALTLGPGDYYVTVTGGSGFAAIGETSAPTVVLDPSVVLLGNFLNCCQATSYVPSLITPWAFSSFGLVINGDPPSAIPEPSTLMLAPVALAAMFLRRLR